MGKKGDELRRAKKQNVVYTFTREQLEARDAVAFEEFKKDIIKQVKAEAYEIDKKRAEELNRRVNEEWERREKEFASGDTEETFMNFMKYFLNLSCRVLIEQFGWKPARSCPGRPTKIMKYAAALVAEVGKITTDKNADIRGYCKETYEKYGVRFEVDDTE